MTGKANMITQRAVWVVTYTTPHYTDILGIFTTEKKAMTWLDNYVSEADDPGGLDIEQMQVNPEPEEKMPSE